MRLRTDHVQIWLFYRLARIALPARLSLARPRASLIHHPISTISLRSTVPPRLPTTRYGESLSAYSTSSVATFPVAPGEYGHPPSPPTDVSIVRIPCESALITFATPMP